MALPTPASTGRERSVLKRRSVNDLVYLVQALSPVYGALSQARALMLGNLKRARTTWSSEADIRTGTGVTYIWHTTD